MRDCRWLPCLTSPLPERWGLWIEAERKANEARSEAIRASAVGPGPRHIENKFARVVRILLSAGGRSPKQ